MGRKIPIQPQHERPCRRQDLWVDRDEFAQRSRQLFRCGLNEEQQHECRKRHEGPDASPSCLRAAVREKGIQIERREHRGKQGSDCEKASRCSKPRERRHGGAEKTEQGSPITQGEEPANRCGCDGSAPASARQVLDCEKRQRQRCKADVSK